MDPLVIQLEKYSNMLVGKECGGRPERPIARDDLSPGLLVVYRYAKELMDDVVDRYHINRYEDFTCDRMKNLAEALNMFKNNDPETII